MRLPIKYLITVAMCIGIGALALHTYKSVVRSLRMYEPGSELHNAIRCHDNNKAVTLIKQGADINAVGRIYGFEGTPLCIAADRGNEDMVRILLERGADVNKGSPLCYAAEHGFENIVALLMDHGADVNAEHSKYGTPLCCAVHSDNLNIVTLLLNHGADPNAIYGSAVAGAVGRGNMKITKLFVANGASLRDMEHYAVRSESQEMVMYLLSNGASFNNSQVVWHSAVFGSLDMVKLLVSLGVDYESYLGDSAISPLHLAAGYGRLPIVKYFVEMGMDINYRTSGRQTPLHYACEDCYYSNIDVVRYLIDKGADINAINYWGKTPLDIIKSSNIHDARAMEATLIAHGAKTSAELKSLKAP